MTHGERYYLHCPLCGEEVEFEMTQAGNEVLASGERCGSCNQHIGLTDRRAMNKPIGETGLSQKLTITLDDNIGDD